MENKNKVKILLLILLCGIFIARCGKDSDDWDDRRSERSERSEKKKKIVVKSENGVKYTSYQDACIAGDFVSAHRYTTKMREKGIVGVEYAEEYVFREEVLFLMSQGTEIAQQRIIYLLKQYPSDSNCDMLVELAIEYDQEDFVKSLTRHYKSNMSSSILRKIVEYLYLEKGDENIDFVYTLLNRYGEIDLLLHAAIEKEDMALVNSLAKNYKGDMPSDILRKIVEYLYIEGNGNEEDIDFVSTLLDRYGKIDLLLLAAIEKDDMALVKSLAKNYNGDMPSDVLRKIVEYLYIEGNGNKEDLDFVCTLLNRYGKIDLLLHAAIEKEDMALVKKLVKSYKVVLSLSELEKVAPTLMKAKDSDIEGMITANIVKLQPSGAMPIEFHNYEGRFDYEPVLMYIGETNKYNTICLKMLDLAIQNKNRSLAKKIVSIVKPSYDYTDFRDLTGEICVKSKNEKAIKEAKKKLEEAIAAGLI